MSHDLYCCTDDISSYFCDINNGARSAPHQSVDARPSAGHGTVQLTTYIRSIYVSSVSHNVVECQSLRSAGKQLYMASTQFPHGSNPDMVEFVIKSPTGGNTPTFTLRASLASTVLDLKKQLQKEYPSHPETQCQTVSQANCVLQRGNPANSCSCCRSYMLEKFSGKMAYVSKTSCDL